jgi:carotenoid cleavage dioxygenase-like enzyme
MFFVTNTNPVVAPVPVCTAAQLAFVPDRHPLSPAWLHDFATTEQYAVLLEQPLYMSLASLLLGSAASHLFMNWQPQDEMRVHLVPLDGSAVSGDAASLQRLLLLHPPNCCLILRT